MGVFLLLIKVCNYNFLIITCQFCDDDVYISSTKYWYFYLLQGGILFP